MDETEEVPSTDAMLAREASDSMLPIDCRSGKEERETSDSSDVRLLTSSIVGAGRGGEDGGRSTSSYTSAE